jgi:hypothetical protein
MDQLVNYVTDTQQGNYKMRADLEERTTLNSRKQLTPEKNVEIWDRIIQGSIKNMDFQLAQMRDLNVKLGKLSKSCLAITIDLNSLINELRNLWHHNNFKGKFDSLLTHSRALASRSSSIQDRTKTIDGSLKQSYHVMKQDFTKKQIEEELSDWLFAEDFPLKLWAQIK